MLTFYFAAKYTNLSEIKEENHVLLVIIFIKYFLSGSHFISLISPKLHNFVSTGHSLIPSRMNRRWPRLWIIYINYQCSPNNVNRSLRLCGMVRYFRIGRNSWSDTEPTCPEKLLPYISIDLCKLVYTVKLVNRYKMIWSTICNPNLIPGDPWPLDQNIMVKNSNKFSWSPITKRSGYAFWVSLFEAIWCKALKTTVFAS